MTFEDFKASLEAASPPPGLSRPLQALWQDAKGNWDTAHGHAQAATDADGAWVHAYLHRVEGDESNAGYWYRRAAKPHATAPLPEEWAEIARSLL